MTGEFEKWLKAALPRNRAGMEDCKVFIQLWDAKSVEDALVVLQTGLAVLLDKPIYLVVPLGMKILLPENLRRLARGVLEVDTSTEPGRKRAAAWLAEQIEAEESR